MPDSRVCWLLVVPALVAAAPATQPQLVEHTTAPRTRLIFCDNPTFSPITIFFEIDLTNATAAERLPVTRAIPGKSRLLLATLRPANALRPMGYKWNWTWRPGDMDAEPDPKAVYALPFRKGTKWTVCQGPSGKFSHTGELENAVDFDMNSGTDVLAAREGVAVAIKSDSNEGGESFDKFHDKANYVEVLHSDRTIGSYMHLKQNGAAVKPGQNVKTGDVLGQSGATGYASGPHLHLHVYVGVDGKTIRSVPLKFRTTRKEPEELVEGRKYVAP